MDSFVGNVLKAAILPIILLALLGSLSQCGKKDVGCPVDPLTKKPACSKFTDYDAWSRATIARQGRILNER